MLKISKILEIENYEITSLFNDGQIRKMDIYPLIQNHVHLKGVNKLIDQDIFKNAKLGEFGEIYWPNLVETKDTMLVNYDISPEFFYYNSTVCK